MTPTSPDSAEYPAGVSMYFAEQIRRLEGFRVETERLIRTGDTRIGEILLPIVDAGKALQDEVNRLREADAKAG